MRRSRGGAKSYDGEKVHFSINHSILSGKSLKCANAAFFTFQCGERRLELLDILESVQQVGVEGGEGATLHLLLSQEQVHLLSSLAAP
jgi:hypothetical protein